MLAIVKSGSLTSGVKVKELERSIGEYLGNPRVLVTANNTFASLIALTALDVGPGDEVIASPMACLASTQPILGVRAKAIWADIDPSTGSLDPDDVRRRVTPRTKAIIHYHWCGYPGYIAEINAIGTEHGIPVLDDGIESFGAEYRGARIGAVGTDVTSFSLQTVRLPNAVDGGALTFTSQELYERAIRIRDQGIDRSTFRDQWGEISPTSDIPIIGYNAIMSELNAHVGLSVMRHVPRLLAKQRENARFWDARLPRGATPLHHPDATPNYWVYSYLAADQMAELERWRSYDVYASKVHLRNDRYSCFGRAPYALPGVDEFERRQLSVPSGWWVRDELPPALPDWT